MIRKEERIMGIRGKKLLMLGLTLTVLGGMTACGGDNKPASEKVSEQAAEQQTSAESTESTESEKNVPIRTGKHEKMIGTITVKSEQIMIEPALTVSSVFDVKLAVKGDKAYILSDGKVKEYTYANGKLSFRKDIKLENDYRKMEMTKDGTLRLSSFMKPYIGLKNEKQIFSYDDLDNVTVHPSGKWGLSFFTNAAKVNKVTFQGDSVKKSGFPLKEMELVREIQIDDNYIYASGTAKGKGDVYVFIYNHKGKLVKKLKDSDGSGLGSPTWQMQTKKGFIALDGNMRAFDLWDKSGKWIGQARSNELFGTSYPWLSDGQLMPDGSLLVIMTQSRADKKTDEALVYKVTGFQ